MENNLIEEDLVVVRMVVMEEGPDVVTLVTRVVVLLLLAVIFLVASVLNTVFLVIFYRRPSLRSISNRFIVSLTVVNLVTGWIVLPLVAVDVFLPQWALNLWEATVLCRTLDVAAEFTSSLAIFATLMIAVDRFCAITNPLHYHMLVTYGKMCTMIAGTWLSAAVIAAAAAPGGNVGRPWNICHHSNSSHMSEESEMVSQEVVIWSYRSYYVICNMVISITIPMSIILWIYFRIYRAAEKNSERTRRNSLCGSSHDAVGSRRGSSKGPSRTSSTRSTSSQMVTNLRHRLSNASLFLHKEESRAAKISNMFFVCWLPCYCFTHMHSGLVKMKVPEIVHYVVMVLALSNSAVSPYIYLYRSRRIQREVRRLFGLSLKSSLGGSRGFNSARRLPLRLQLEMIPPSPTVLDGNFDLDSTTIALYHNLQPKIIPVHVSPFTTVINKLFRLNSIKSEPWEDVVTPTSSNSSNTNSNSITMSSSTTSSSSAVTGTPVEETESMLPRMLTGIHHQPELH
ncbi:unnamed protein product, partial [Meganyctiphanes norvegica]